MSYSSQSIALVVDQINNSLFLPAIQRPYVWETNQVVALFDSLLKGYPISSFLFWEVAPENRDDWEVYKFIDNFRMGGMHNALAETDGLKITLVLDGQQRLTSLLIGLRGTYTTRRKYARREKPENWIKQRLYLNLLKSPRLGDEEGGAENGITYGLQFFDDIPRNRDNQHWFKMGSILDCTSDDEFDELVDSVVDHLPSEITRSDRRVVEKNLDRLYRVIWKDDVIAYYTEKDQSLDRVLDIFIRANDGGTKLSKSDLLLSMITSKWKGVSARQEIFDCVDYLNDGLEARNNLSKDFVMKASLVLSDLDVIYKVNNFTNANLATIEDNWPKIKKTLEGTLRLVNALGIDKETLTSTNALMPIAYYLHRIGDPLNGTTPFEIGNVANIQRFLIGALLNGAFGGNSDQAISTSRTLIRNALETKTDFPNIELDEGLRRKGRLITFNKDNIHGLFEMTYGKKNCFLALSLLYDGQPWGTTGFHIDHIIPRSLANRERLMTMNVPENKIADILSSVDRLGNLQILLGRENREKSDTPFKHWIVSRDPEFANRHMIPTDMELWDVEMLPDFVREREKLIENRIKRDYKLQTASQPAIGAE